MPTVTQDLRHNHTYLTVTSVITTPTVTQDLRHNHTNHDTRRLLLHRSYVKTKPTAAQNLRRSNHAYRRTQGLSPFGS
jgi:hypothetical protein